MTSHPFQSDTTLDIEAFVDGVDTLFKSIEEKAADIIMNIFPRKILALNKLYESIPSVDYEKLGTELKAAMELHRQKLKGAGSGSGGESKKRKADDFEAVSTGATDAKIETKDMEFPVNKTVVDLIDRLKNEIEELVHNAGAVKMWININIPRIEDGNNFGVSIQEEAVSELGRAEDSSFNVMESVTKYHVTRGKLVSKMLKYPGIQDYARCVLELDEKEYISLRLCCLDLRNNYCVLFDMIRKNLEKLKRPRGQPHSTTQMY